MRRKISVVVDDEPAVRAYVGAVLQQEDFEIVEAGSGRDALEIVQNLEGRVDLVVTDVQMPGGDGLTFASSVKQSYPEVPIILVSGHERPETEFKFLQKPFGPAALLEAIRQTDTKIPRTNSAAGRSSIAD